jgi:uncharacterized membrane-anchored protein YjiN (DUF445 family)
VPRRQRRLALAVLLTAAGVAVVAFPFRATWWGGLLLAVAEAGIVGGLADWFAVTALFRRPLGLPIPHTALIPANWELLAARVGTMVGDRVLTRDYLTREVAALDVAGLLEGGAARIGRADLEATARRVASWVATELPATAAEELTQHLGRWLATRPVTPALAWLVDAGRREGWDRRLVGTALQALADAMERPAVRRVVEELVEDLLIRYRERASAMPRVWLAVADFLGLVDRQRIVTALGVAAREVARDPEHPLRQQLLDAMAGLPARLRADPELAARLEAVKDELFASPAVAAFLRDLAAAVHRALVADLVTADSATVAWVVERLDQARSAIIRDAGLRDELAVWLKRRTIDVVERHHGELATLIEKGVRALGPAGAVRLVEEHAGDDLQYIRVNGTIVGGLTGGAIYLFHRLLA